MFLLTFGKGKEYSLIIRGNGMNDNVKKLNAILRSKQAKDEYYRAIEQDKVFRAWLLGVLPEVEDCRRQQQNNPWHIYNVLDHTLVAVEAMNHLSMHCTDKEKLMLSYVMLLHDMGKPECHIVTLDKQGKQKDSFYNHHLASAKIAKRVLGQFGFAAQEANTITILVQDHDFFMHLFKEINFESSHLLAAAKAKITELNKLGDGYKLNAMLTKVGLADNLAQNPTLTKPGIALIKQYETISSSLGFTAKTLG